MTNWDWPLEEEEASGTTCWVRGDAVEKLEWAFFFFRFLGLHNTIPSSPKSQRCNFRLGHLFFGFFFLLLQWKKTDVVTVGFVSQDKWFTPTQIVWVSDVTTNGPGKKEEINNQSLIINNELIINSHFSTYII